MMKYANLPLIFPSGVSIRAWRPLGGSLMQLSWAAMPRDDILLLETSVRIGLGPLLRAEQLRVGNVTSHSDPP